MKLGVRNHQVLNRQLRSYWRDFFSCKTHRPVSGTDLPVGFSGYACIKISQPLNYWWSFVHRLSKPCWQLDLLLYEVVITALVIVIEDGDFVPRLGMNNELYWIFWTFHWFWAFYWFSFWTWAFCLIAIERFSAPFLRLFGTSRTGYHFYLYRKARSDQKIHILSNMSCISAKESVSFRLEIRDFTIWLS